jgi:hypothetical protein
MKKLLGVVVALLTVPAWGGDLLIDCKSLIACRFPAGWVLPYEIPGLAFQALGPTDYTVTANFWWASGCPGDPNIIDGGSGYVPGAGLWYEGIDIDKQPDGTEYSIQWTIDGCPTLDCVDGVIGSTPDECPL